MGIAALKEELREKIITYKYHVSREDIWEILDTYDRYLAFSDSKNELAEAAFLRGDVAFHLGRYHETVEALTKSLQIEKTQEYEHLEADAHNLLGMLFYYLGYETVALDSYLSAVQSARKKKNIFGEVSALLNIGLLYENLHDYNKAMQYYNRGADVAGGEFSGPKILLLLLCMIQQAQLLCKTNRYELAVKKKREIDSYYHIVMQEELILSECILEVYLAVHDKDEQRTEELIQSIRHFLETDTDYVEQIDFYIDFCRFLLDQDRKEDARVFMDLLREKLGVTEFLHLRIKMEELEIRYQKQYCDRQRYLDSCVRYMNLEKEYAKAIKNFRCRNLLNVENLQEVEKKRLEFELRSKCDLATGLLNKEAFKQEVESYLNKRKRDVMDAMIMIDIDNFKLINDSFGHLIGDAVIAGLSALIRDAFGRDICGRFGGDEFLLFVRGPVEMEEVETGVERLREEFHNLAFGRNKDVHVTLSIGVSYNNGVNASYHTMFSCADEALAKAKEYGKNRVAFFEIKRGMLKYV